MKSKLLIPILLTAFAAAMHAQNITIDQFLTGGANYSAGDLNSQNPTRTGASGAWTAHADYDVSTTGLTLSGLPTAGGSVAVSLNPTGGATTWRSATEAMSNPGTTTTYLSFLLSSDRSSNIRLGFGANGSRFIGTSQGSFIAGSTTGGTFNINTTYLLVAKLEHNASGNDERISLWTYADGVSIPISEAAAGAYTVQGVGNIIQTSGAWQPNPGWFYSNDHASATASASFDELRITKSWASALGYSVWTNTAGSDWNTGANWETGAVPNTAGAGVLITNFASAGSYTISASTAQTNTLGRLDFGNSNSTAAITNTLAANAGLKFQTVSGNAQLNLYTAGAGSVMAIQAPIELATNLVVSVFRNGSTEIAPTVSGAINLGGSANELRFGTNRQADINVTGQISGSGGLRVENPGSTNRAVVLSGSNSFTGTTTVSGGTLKLDSSTGHALGGTTNVTVSGGILLISQNNQVNNAAVVTLSGGTVERASGVSEVFGDLNVTAASILDFGSGTTGTFQFQGYANTLSNTITVNNFAAGNKLQFLTNSFGAPNLAQFSFGSFAYTTGTEGNYFTITAIPEPSTLVAALGLLGLMGWPAVRRLRTRRP